MCSASVINTVTSILLDDSLCMGCHRMPSPFPLSVVGSRIWKARSQPTMDTAIANLGAPPSAPPTEVRGLRALSVLLHPA